MIIPHLHIKTLPEAPGDIWSPLCRAHSNRRDEQSSPADTETSTGTHLHGMKYLLVWGPDNLSDSSHLLNLLKIHSCQGKNTFLNISHLKSYKGGSTTALTLQIGNWKIY